MPSGDLLSWGIFDTARMITDIENDILGGMAGNLSDMVDSKNIEKFAQSIGPGWMYGRRVDDGLQFHFGYLEPAE